MNLDEAIAKAAKVRPCITGDWLETIDPKDVQRIADYRETLPLYRLWRAAKLIGFNGSNTSWTTHWEGRCGCSSKLSK